MATSTTRNLGFLSWNDPDAWMESMKGSQWDALVKEENDRLTEVLKRHTTPEQIATFKEELKTASQLYDIELGLGLGSTHHSAAIYITYGKSGGGIHWRFDDEDPSITPKRVASDLQYYDATDADDDTTTTTTSYIIYTHDIGKGAEEYELVVLDATTKKQIWKHSPVGPMFSIGHDTIYYLGVSQKLWYNRLFACRIATGSDRIQLYEEKDGHYNLSIVKGLFHMPDYDLPPIPHTYLVRENSGKTDTFYINENHTLTPIAPGTARQVPVSSTEYYYYRDADKDEYHRSPELMEHFHLQSLVKEGTPIGVGSRNTLLVRKHGELFILPIFYESRFEVYHITQGSIQLNTFSSSDIYRVDNGIEPPFLRISGKTTKSDFNSATKTFKLKVKKVRATSRDGTVVHGVLLFKSIYTRPKALLAVGYGAYGAPTSPAGCYGKWAPLLERGWGILYTYIRGGGDDTDAWAQAGRLEGRARTCEDFLALVEAAQNLAKVAAAATVIYGRSAGGLLMGMSLSKEPTGRLFRTVYTEVPYVDILRTTTNPSLPLTKMEYNEFGDPAHRPQDFGFLVNMSPADLAVTLEAPDVFVLARTGLNDSEVYAYEPVKWIRRLRKNSGNNNNKVIGIAIGEGHFYSEHTALQAKAEDLALLHNIVGLGGGK